MEIWDLYNWDREVIGEQQNKWMSREEITKLKDEGKLVYSIKDLDYFFDEMDEN